MIPQSIIYAGLAGVVIALIVATATQRWQLRVFVLLALRLAIGWHFLFEGLHKIHSQYIGPSETNRAFTSEPYFAAGEGPLAEKMRKDYLGDPVAIYTARLTPPEPVSVEDFLKLELKEQASLCPASVASDLKLDATAMDAMTKIATTLRDEWTKLPDGTAEEKAKKLEVEVKANVAEAKLKIASHDSRELRARYAAWVYGVTGATWLPKDSKWDSKLKSITVSSPDAGLSLSGPQRLQHIGLLQKQFSELQERQSVHLGRGDGVELTKTKTSRTELLAAKNDLAKETEAFINELRKEIDQPPLAPPGKAEMKQLDKMTAWGITIIGACILIGLCTPLACLAGAGFLAMTYLTHPTVPWLSLPPMTEGNPLFVNKNIIEMLALLVVAAHPTGRWLGLDALWTHFLQPKAAQPRV